MKTHILYNMNFNSLYKLNNKGKIYQWDVKVVEHGDGTYDIVTSNGEKTGKKVIHTRNVPKGKAKRTVLEQAISEAISKRKAKMKKECYTENLADLDDPKKSRIIRPMLAVKFAMSLAKNSKKSGITFPCACQRKLDGLRMMAHREGNQIVIESRQGLVFENFDKLKKDLFEVLKDQPEGFYLDGELYTNDLMFNKISGVCKKLQDTLTDEEVETINKIHYHVYDCFDLDDMDIPLSRRLEIIDELPKVDMVDIVETIHVESEQDILHNHSKFVEEGYEGTMLRNYDSVYQLNKRSKDLQKYKNFMEKEFTIVGYHEGQGDEAGMVVWECETKDGGEFAVRPRGTREMKREWFKNADDYIGKPLTVIFQEYSEYGIPRFPVGKDIREGY